jgi:hypothetical membrane protein
MTSTRTVCLRVTSRGAGLLGLASVATILAGMAFTAMAYRGYAGESYSPLNHFISELGEVAASRFAWLFNLGLVVGGLGLGAFLLLLAVRMAGGYRTAFMAAGVVAGVSGTLVGVFPMDYHAPHRLVSMVFFLSGWLVAVIFSVWLARTRTSGLPRWLAALGPLVGAVFLAFIAVFATYHPADAYARLVDRPDVWAVPALEWAALLSLLAWFVCVSLVLLREADSSA